MMSSAPQPEPPVAADVTGVPHTSGGQDVLVMFAMLSGMAAAALLIQALLAHMLLPEGRGAYAVCLVFGTLLGVVFTPGAAQGAQYFVAARRMSVSQGVSSSFIICLVGGGLAAALLLPLIYGMYGDLGFFQKADSQTFLLALTLVPLTAISISLDHQLVAHRRFRRLAIFSLLRIAANASAIAILVWGVGLGVNGAIIAFVVSHCVMIAVCLLDLQRHCGLVPTLPTRSNFTRILGYGLKYHIARIGGIVEAQVGVVVLGQISSQAEIGLFSAASTLMLGFLLISNAVGNALFPRVAGDGRSELVARCVRLVFAATAVCLVGVLVLSVPLVRLLLSEPFLPAVPLLWILAPGILAYACSGIFITHFKGANLPHICSWAVLLGLCVNLCVLVAFYPALGVEAAAYAMTAGLMCACLFLSIAFHRTTSMSWLSIWLPRRSDAGFLWAAGKSVLKRKA